MEKATLSQARANTYRLLNRDGTFNVSRKGINRAPVRDLYHTLLRVKTFEFMGLLMGFYFMINLLFAWGYTLCGPTALEGASRESEARHFLDAFFFSVQTFATIGYGKITPSGILANSLVTLEALTGLLGVAMATGLLFARFSRPTARVIFSDVALIAPHEGVPSFLFRMANAAWL
jgi:inward rectifier potassium channel